MDQLDALLNIVAAVHDTCFDPALWADCLRKVAELLDSNGVVLALEDTSRSFAISFEANTPPESSATYLSEYHKIDPVIAFGRRAPVGRSYVDGMAIERSDFERSRFHAEFALRFGYACCIQAFTHQSDGCSGFFVAARSSRAEAFDQEERRLLDHLVPHFERALRLRTLLERADLARVEALDVLHEMADGVILVDDDLTITFANPEAHRLLSGRDGLLSVGSRLTAATSADTARLRHGVIAISSGGLDAGPSIFPIGRPPPKRPLFVRIAKLSAAMAFQLQRKTARACQFIGDPDRPPSETRALEAALGLTPAEAKVVGLLAAGIDPKAIVMHLQTSPETLRTHIKHVFAKTNTSRQAELVALVKSIPTGRRSMPASGQ